MGIKISNLSFSYGDNEVLHNISLEIKTGERIGIIGESGCGKSTLLKLLSGLYTTQTGLIEVENENTSSQIRKKVSIVMQNAMLFPGTIRENITCGNKINEDVVLNACKAAQLSTWINTLPYGLDTFVGERGGKVSGGQAQRIAIARAIAKQSPIVLLDEATSALDKETGASVLLALHNLMERKTVISVSHHPETFTDYNRIFLLERGMIFDA